MKSRGAFHKRHRPSAGGVKRSAGSPGKPAVFQLSREEVSPQQEQRPLREAVLGQGRAAGRLLHADDRVAFRLLLPQVARQLRRLYLHIHFKSTKSVSHSPATSQISLKTPTRLSLKVFLKTIRHYNQELPQHHRNV